MKLDLILLHLKGHLYFLTNWQQFVLEKDGGSLWEEITGGEMGEQLRGEFLAEFLSEYPNMVIMNDEAHHVHSGKKITMKN
jgi:type III restriction enzyme